MSAAVEDDENVPGLGSRSWQEELASLVETSGIQYPEYYYDYNNNSSSSSTLASTNGNGLVMDDFFDVDKQTPEASPPLEENFRDQVSGFIRASTEMITDLGLGCKDVVHQILVAHGVDSYLMAKFDKVSHRLAFLNHLLPEDRHPIHAWPIIFFVFIITLAVLCVNTQPQIPLSTPKKMYIHPPSATLVQLPDGRHIAYHEQGVPAERARLSLISPHSFLSSRLAGIPGIKESLLEEFGVRLITYDLPGFGESDPHPNRNLNTSAMDMLHIADSVGVNDKFWVVGYSGGGIHAWAALNYIPDRLAGAAMFSPFVNPYDSSMTKEERYRIWEKWTPKRKLMYFLALRFPSILTYIFRRSFLAGEHGQLDKWLALSLGRKDRALIEEPVFEEFWQRDVEESIRQRNIRPFIEEAYLQVSRWGFSLADIQVQRKSWGRGFLPWLKSMYSEAEIEWGGFLGPIHIWQGMEDMVVTPATAEFISRLIPGATIHKLPGEGHFSYFCFCDACHRQIFFTLFGAPQGPLNSTVEVEQFSMEANTELLINTSLEDLEMSAYESDA